MMADEHDDHRYILDLLCQIVNVSIETMKIVEALPLVGFGEVEKSAGGAS